MYRAIMVDDEIWALRGMSSIIPWEEYGFEICSLCKNVEEALTAIDEYKPDIIFTDVRMPFMSGMDLLDRINMMGVDVLTVIVSAYRDFEVAKQAIVSGVFAYVVKPLDKEEIKDLAIRARQKLDENHSGQGHTLTSFDLSDESKYKNLKLQQLLRAAAQLPCCYLAIAQTNEICHSLFGEAGYNAAYVNGYKDACLLCGEYKAETAALYSGKIGISMKHNDFSDIPSMLHEASAALEGGFIYSDNKSVSSIQLYLAEEYAHKLNLKDIAEKFYISEPYLYELFKKNTNTTVVSFIKNLRMQHAAYLLRYTDQSVKTIAEASGYEDAGYFGRLFRKELQCSPEAYRHRFRT